MSELNPNLYEGTYNSTLGKLKISANLGGITSIQFDETPQQYNENQIIQNCKEQLREYFENKRRQFDLPLVIEGTFFQKKVWNQLIKLPFGKTMSYGELANLLKMPNSARAVGSANRANPIAIVIPCHRIIGSNGKLTGYAGGLDRKEALLSFEKCELSNSEY